MFSLQCKLLILQLLFLPLFLRKFARGQNSEARGGLTVEVRGQDSIIMITGQNRTVRCVATWTSSPNIAWQRRDSSGKTYSVSQRQDRISQSKGPVNSWRYADLKISNVMRSDAGEYVCRASTIVTSPADRIVLRRTLQLAVYDPITVTLTRNTLRLSTSQSSSYRVICQVSSIPRPTVSWMRDGQAVSETFSSGVYQTQPTASGSPAGEIVSSSLILSRLSLDDAGVYTCVASNDVINMPERRNLTVIVTDPVRVELSTSEITVVKGEGGSVRCTAYGYPTPSVQWRTGQSSSPISFKESQNINETVVTSDVQFSNVQVTDAGIYTCFASNNDTAAQKFIIAIVLAPAEVSISMSRVTVVRGSQNESTIECTATGNPTPDVKWMRNGEAVTHSSTSPIHQQPVLETDARVVLSINDQVDYSDAGDYTCFANNTVNGTFRLVSSILEILVVGPPELHPDTQYVVPVRNNSMELNCMFFGTDPLSIEWSFSNNSKIPRTSQFVIGPLRFTGGDTSRKLTVYGLECKDFSLISYICTATNNYKETPVTSPPFFADIDISTLALVGNASSCRLAAASCRAIGQELVIVPSEAVMNTASRYVESRNQVDFWISSRSAEYSTELGEGNVEGCIRIHAPSNSRASDQTKTAVALCELSSQQAFVTNLRTDPDLCDGTRMEISWMPKPQYSTIRHQLLVNDIIHDTFEPTERSTTLKGLSPRTNYSIEILPLLRGCGNSPSNTNIAETGRGNLTAPDSIGMRLSVMENHCTVSWTSNQNHVDELERYQINITADVHDKSPDLGNSIVKNYNGRSAANANEYRMEDLSPNTRYVVRVGAVPSAPCMEKIPIAWSMAQSGCITAPASPDSVELSSNPPTTDKEEVTVTLNPINQRNGLISCFMLVVEKVREGDNRSKETDVNKLVQAGESFQKDDAFIALAIPRFSEEFAMTLGDNSTSCCNDTKLGEEANCTASIKVTERNLTETTSIIWGQNRALEANVQYTYYVIVSTPSNSVVLYAASNRSQSFTSPRGSSAPSSYPGKSFAGLFTIIIALHCTLSPILLNI